MGRRTLCSTPRSGGYNKSSGGGNGVYYGGGGRRHHTHLSTTRDSYHKQLWSKSRSPKSTVDDVELQTGGGATISMSKNLKSPQNTAELQDDDDDLLVVTTPATAAESETYFAGEVGVGGEMGDGLRYSHDANAESQESILVLMGHRRQDLEDHNGHEHEHELDGEGHGQLQPQKRTGNHGMVDDRTRSSVATTMSGVVIGHGHETGLNGGGGGRGVISRTPTPMGMIMRTQEVTMTIEQTTQGGVGGGFDAGHGTDNGGDVPAYPARTASLRW